MMHARTWTLAMMLAVALAACAGDGGNDAATDAGTDVVGDDDDDTTLTGDDDDDGVDFVSCDEPFDPCGGDPTGDWDVAAVCAIALDTESLNCEGAAVEVIEDRSSGTVSLQASGVYDRRYELDLDYELTVPNDCLVGPLTCNSLANLLGDLADDCAEVGTDCVCTGTLNTIDAYAGTWDIENGNVVVTDGDDRFQFCIEGNVAESMDEDGNRVHWSR